MSKYAYLQRTYAFEQGKEAILDEFTRCQGCDAISHVMRQC